MQAVWEDVLQHGSCQATHPLCASGTGPETCLRAVYCQVSLLSSPSSSSLSSLSSTSAIIILHPLDTTVIIVQCLHHTQDQRSMSVYCVLLGKSPVIIVTILFTFVSVIIIVSSLYFIHQIPLSSLYGACTTHRTLCTATVLGKSVIIITIIIIIVILIICHHHASLIGYHHHHACTTHRTREACLYALYCYCHHHHHHLS